MSSPCTLHDQGGRYCEFANTEETVWTHMFGERRLWLPRKHWFIFEFPDQQGVVDLPHDGENEDLPFLGGLNETTTPENPYDETSIFNRLSRPRKIPVSPRLSSIHPPIYPQSVATIFEILMNGPLLVSVLEAQHGFLLESVVNVPTPEGDDPSHTPGKKIVFSIFFGESCGMSIHGNPNYMGFWDTLNRPQRRAVANRVVHRVLRSHGFRLPTEFIAIATQTLVVSYVRCRLYTEALDVAIVAADLAVSNNLGVVARLQVFYKVAEALEACERFLDAGTLWLELAAMVCDNENLRTAHNNAGLAFKRGGNYTFAEECYVKALFYQKQPSWVNLLCLYFHEARWGASGGEVLGDKTELCLLGLLSVTGYPLFELAQSAQSCANCLKPGFRRPAQARRALIDATSTDSVQSFRSKLSSCYNSNLAHTKVAVLFSSVGIKEHRRSARELLLGPLEFQFLAVECFGPGCTASVGLKRCPCHTVQYCSKECQRAHWHHSHKHNCMQSFDGDSGANESAGAS